jgi:hypothetical protein
MNRKRAKELVKDVLVAILLAITLIALVAHRLLRPR